MRSRLGVVGPYLALVHALYTLADFGRHSVRQKIPWAPLRNASTTSSDWSSSSSMITRGRVCKVCSSRNDEQSGERTVLEPRANHRDVGL